MTKRSTKAPAKQPAATNAAPVKAAGEKAESNKLAKSGLVDLVAEKTGLSRQQGDAAVQAILDCLVATVQEGKSVTLNGVGTFSVRATAARTGVRPGTSDKIQIPAGKRLRFKVSRVLKGQI